MGPQSMWLECDEGGWIQHAVAIDFKHEYTAKAYKRHSTHACAACYTLLFSNKDTTIRGSYSITTSDCGIFTTET